MNGLPTFTRSLRDQIQHPIPVPDFDFLKSGSHFAELPTKWFVSQITSWLPCSFS